MRQCVTEDGSGKPRRTSRVWPLVVLLSILAGLSRADVLDDWNEAMLNAVRRENTAPVLAARNLAILHLAIFDAINSVDRTRVPYRSLVPARGAVSRELVVAAAGYGVAAALFPTERRSFELLWMDRMSCSGSDEERTNSIAMGAAAARALLEERASDGAQMALTYFPSNHPGAWRRTPPHFRPPELPNWRCLKPFAMTSCEQFRPPPPPRLDGAQYAADLNEIKLLGGRNSTARTPAETETARFWSDFTGTVTPPGHWNQMARGIANDRGLKLAEKARLLALLNLALADAGIIAWDAKYTYNFWRPITAVRNADNDGNAETTAEKDWQPLLTSPPFPEYISGHSAFSGAAATVLGLFFGSDQIDFRVGSDTLPGVFREYHDLAATAREIGHSRILGGIHFTSSDKAGRASGGALGEYVFRHFLLAKAGTMRNQRAQAGSIPFIFALAPADRAHSGVIPTWLSGGRDQAGMRNEFIRSD